MALRGQTISVTSQLVTETCFHCGMLWAMTEDFKRERVRDGQSFYCPSGHGQIYTARKELEEKLRLKEAGLTRVKSNTLWYQERLKDTESRLDTTQHRLNATKLSVTCIASTKPKAGRLDHETQG